MKQPRLAKFNFETVTVGNFGQITQRIEKQSDGLIFQLPDGIELEMIEIPGGSFMMGSSEDETESRMNEKPLHKVNVHPFYLGRFPITQSQWQCVMRELPQISEDFRTDNFPVVNVFLEKAVEFCDRLYKLTAYKFRLPTEAEWEYTCRANTTTPFSFGSTITTELANFDGDKPYSQTAKGESRQKLTSVGYFNFANTFGLYDMHGNVWEWCADIWHEDYINAPTDGSAWLENGDQSYCVQRGGSWRDGSGKCRSAFRVGDIAHNSDHIVGLRVCLSAT